MATITQTNAVGQAGAFTVTRTTMTASDTLTYDSTSGVRQLLIITNDTGGALNVVIDGSGGTTIAGPDGYGQTIDVSSGITIAVADATVKAVELKRISAFLQGTIAITGGTNAKAMLIKLA